ncbi:hypothetical protein RFI_21808 [Reticulomyxa filosa]|uniref:Uncharacterized protein n=1 Tax=Reticulomyxa filosa TaxID=46433 RepID=X6MPF4_RETFI|nr:hypothetical protein RFI_21808 [Reticulomyxa filosa]|eukprot:ETO15556.1 hypothetical protein RFI_21808 [Reticulomyxa filosa]
MQNLIPKKKTCENIFQKQKKNNFLKTLSNNNSISKLSDNCIGDVVNQITLLSFGGANKSNNYNEWVPFTDVHNHLIIIESYCDNYNGVRALIGGSNNHLLFITYYQNNISVFDLNTFQFIKYKRLPIYSGILGVNFLFYPTVLYHYFVPNSENGRRQETMKTNKQNYQIPNFQRTY